MQPHAPTPAALGAHMDDPAVFRGEFRGEFTTLPSFGLGLKDVRGSDVLSGFGTTGASAGGVLPRGVARAGGGALLPYPSRPPPLPLTPHPTPVPPQALALAACYHEEWPALVVVPSSLTPTPPSLTPHPTPLTRTPAGAGAGGVLPRGVARAGGGAPLPAARVGGGAGQDAAKAKLSGRFNIVSYNLMAKVRTRSVPSTFERPLSSFRGRVGCEAPPNTPRQPECATPPS
eukprot:1181094-Prorocentrum_minimum.AAC.2